MKGFREYMLYRNYQLSTVKGIEGIIQNFLNWLENENIEIEEVSYNDLLVLVKKRREQNLGRHTINSHLLGIQHYYGWLINQGKQTHNPAVNLRVKGIIESLPHDILNQKQLDQIYEDYKVETPVQKRNKIIISLVLYQGMVREELQKLESGDINLEKGIIRIRKTVRLQKRVLKLKANQILPLQEYITQIRPKLLKLKKQNTKNYQTDKLLITIGNSHHLKEASRELIYTLRKQHPWFKNFLQVRSSVISLWIKEKNIREVQYMAGHNNIISTQRYVRANLDELKEQLGKFHPLK